MIDNKFPPYSQKYLYRQKQFDLFVGQPPCVRVNYQTPFSFQKLLDGYLHMYNWEKYSHVVSISDVKQIDEDTIQFIRRHEQIIDKESKFYQE